MRIIFAPRSKRHIDGIFDYIRADSPRSAKLVLGRINRSIKRLREFPFSGPVSEVIGCRELAIPQTSYTVYYRVSGDTLEVVAVLHGAQQKPDEF